jgi:hypothetical protein
VREVQEELSLRCGGGIAYQMKWCWVIVPRAKEANAVKTWPTTRVMKRARERGKDGRRRRRRRWRGEREMDRSHDGRRKNRQFTIQVAPHFKQITLLANNGIRATILTGGYVNPLHFHGHWDLERVGSDLLKSMSDMEKTI